MADQGRTVVQAARDYVLSWPVVAAAFPSHARAVLPAQPEPVRALGIDEIRRGRPRWNPDEASGIWQTAVNRWHVGFVDLSGKQGLLGQVEGRTAHAVIAWPAGRDRAWRDTVQYVAIDMCTIFKSAIRIKTIARDAYGFRNPATTLTHPLRDHPSSPWTPRCLLISLSPRPAIVLAGGTELSVPQVSTWL
ncbi:hypothetical protein ABZV61_33170 [Streptomyces sp900116325]|uniref:Transposase n=1 Tax=Streptomyces sp. 900116325 TaxID=3154295 RepID=A0ABV2UJC5_9ACTN